MRILIVEDEEQLAKSIKSSLEDEGYSVDYVLDGEKGERRWSLNHAEYDLVILDLMLPKKDGLTVLKNIREKYKVNTPVLVLTGKFDIKDKVAALDMGADDYLVKPFSFEELHSRIKALLRRPEQVLPEVLEINGIKLNLNTRKVYRKGKEIELTLKEFNLLEYFMRNPGRVISREEILDHLWDFGFSSFSNITDVHIKNLRKKLCDNPHEKIIETVRGIGYRFKDKEL